MLSNNKKIFLLRIKSKKCYAFSSIIEIKIDIALRQDKYHNFIKSKFNNLVLTIISKLKYLYVVIRSNDY